MCLRKSFQDETSVEALPLRGVESSPCASFVRQDLEIYLWKFGSRMTHPVEPLVAHVCICHQIRVARDSLLLLKLILFFCFNSKN